MLFKLITLIGLKLSQKQNLIIWSLFGQISLFCFTNKTVLVLFIISDLLHTIGLLTKILVKSAKKQQNLTILYMVNICLNIGVFYTFGDCFF